MIQIINVMLHEQPAACPKEIIYTRCNLPSFLAPLMDVKNASIEQVDLKLPVIMKDGSISEVTLTDWKIQCHFDGTDWYGNAHTTNGGNKSIPESHVEIWCNENNNNGQYIYAKPSFPIEAVCVDRNYNRDGLYLFLREYEGKPGLTKQEKWDAVSHFFLLFQGIEEDVVSIPGVKIIPREWEGKVWVDYKECISPDSLSIVVSQENGIYSSRWVAAWGNICLVRIFDRDHSHLVEYSY